VAAQRAASARAASIVSARTAGQIVSIVTVLAADQRAAVAVALAVVSDARKRPLGSSIRRREVVADLARLFSQIWVLLSLAACNQDLSS
jgi:hypothetical protein